VAWTFQLMAQMRQAIVDGRFAQFRAEVLQVWGGG
jgi:queuine/archaeosine tRNA-ribosyltransferase